MMVKLFLYRYLQRYIKWNQKSYSTRMITYLDQNQIMRDFVGMRTIPP